MHVFYHRHLVRKRTKDALLVETKSGRTIMLLVPLLIVLGILPLLLLIAVPVCIALWTNSEEWCFNRRDGKIFTWRSIVGFKYRELDFGYHELDSLDIKRVDEGLDGGYAYSLQMRFTGGLVFEVARNNRVKVLKELLSDVYDYLPKKDWPKIDDPMTN